MLFHSNPLCALTHFIATQLDSGRIQATEIVEFVGDNFGLICSGRRGIKTKTEIFLVFVELSSGESEHQKVMSSRKVLVYGGRGALGSACIAKFKELNWVS